MSELAVLCPEGAGTIDGARKSGDYRIAWEGPEGATFRLLEDRGHDKSVLYEGTERATTVTGRPAGDYGYRVARIEDGVVVERSDSCTVLVRPYSLTLALAFFLFGLALTVATVLLVVRGHRAHRRGEIG